MQAGSLRWRITIQSPSASTNPFAQNNETTWTNVATMWASISPLSSKEIFQVGQISMRVSHKVTIRYPGVHIVVAAGYRILFKNRIFELQTGIINPDERNILLELLAFEIDPSR